MVVESKQCKILLEVVYEKTIFCNLDHRNSYYAYWM